jgi:ribonuclease PH
MREKWSPTQIRTISVTKGYSRHAEGSPLGESGHDRVLATAPLEAKLPPHPGGQTGTSSWPIRESSLLPRTTQLRTQHKPLYPNGRAQEIQRPIDQTWQSVADSNFFSTQSLIIDTTALEPTEGIHCAGILAGYSSPYHLADHVTTTGKKRRTASSIQNPWR